MSYPLTAAYDAYIDVLKIRINPEKPNTSLKIIQDQDGKVIGLDIIDVGEIIPVNKWKKRAQRYKDERDLLADGVKKLMEKMESAKEPESVAKNAQDQVNRVQAKLVPANQSKKADC